MIRVMTGLALLVVLAPAALSEDGAGSMSERRSPSALDAAPPAARAHNVRGEAHFRQGAPERAVRSFDRAIALHPRFARAYNNRGKAYRAMGAIDRAIRDYDKAIALDPRYAAAYNNRGNAYRASGAPGLAIQDYDRAIALRPRHAAYNYNRGLAHKAMGALKRAAADHTLFCDLAEGRLIRQVQKWRTESGHYRGPIDGSCSAALLQAMWTWIADPKLAASAPQIRIWAKARRAGAAGPR